VLRDSVDGAFQDLVLRLWHSWIVGLDKARARSQGRGQGFDSPQVHKHRSLSHQPGWPRFGRPASGLKSRSCWPRHQNETGGQAGPPPRELRIWRTSVSTDENKAVVRRFITEVLVGGKVDLVDELLAPDYVNRAMGTDLTAFKAMLTGLAAALPDRRFDIEDLVADGDAVVARFTSEMTDSTGKAISVRGLTYYRLADGKIVEDDPITTPDLTQALGDLMAGTEPVG
jgi:ketosteroid isomerase-like protein